jgi:hypothetical protein
MHLPVHHHHPWCCSEEYNVLKIQLEGIIEELERHFEQVSRSRWGPCPVGLCGTGPR